MKLDTMESFRTLIPQSLVSSLRSDLSNCCGYPAVQQKRAASPKLTGPQNDDTKLEEWKGKRWSKDTTKIHTVVASQGSQDLKGVVGLAPAG